MTFSQGSKSALLLFLFGCIVAAVLLVAPGSRIIFEMASKSGYPGALVSGIFYAISFTAPFSTAFFVALKGFHPFLVAIFGGFGALLYDVLIFEVARHTLRPKLSDNLKEKFLFHRSFPRWLKMLLGAVILASPLPDELAAGFLGLSSMKTRNFLLLSFVLNTAGIMIIVMIASS